MKKCSSLMKCELLKNSIDESVRKIYKAREEINSKFTRVWRASNIAKTASAEVELDLKFLTQSTQQGLGFGNFNPHPSVSEKRKLVSSKASSFRELKNYSFFNSFKARNLASIVIRVCSSFCNFLCDTSNTWNW